MRQGVGVGCPRPAEGYGTRDTRRQNVVSREMRGLSQTGTYPQQSLTGTAFPCHSLGRILDAGCRGREGGDCPHPHCANHLGSTARKRRSGRRKLGQLSPRTSGPANESQCDWTRAWLGPRQAISTEISEVGHRTPRERVGRSIKAPRRIRARSGSPKN